MGASGIPECSGLLCVKALTVHCHDGLFISLVRLRLSSLGGKCSLCFSVLSDAGVGPDRTRVQNAGSESGRMELSTWRHGGKAAGAAGGGTQHMPDTGRGLQEGAS